MMPPVCWLFIQALRGYVERSINRSLEQARRGMKENPERFGSRWSPFVVDVSRKR